MSRSITLWLVLTASGICFAGGAAVGQQEEKAVQQPAIVPASSGTAASSSAGAAIPAVRTASASAQPAAGSSTMVGTPVTAAASASASAAAVREREAMLTEGEKRFGTNCGRCHQSPHHFPPRMIATVERHMRVRATVTAEDMRLIMLYLTQ